MHEAPAFAVLAKAQWQAEVALFVSVFRLSFAFGRSTWMLVWGYDLLRPVIEFGKYHTHVLTATWRLPWS